MEEESAVRCPNCGAENLEGKRYCGDCGAMIAPPSPPILYQYPPPAYVHKPPYKARINVLCLVGATLAVLSLFLPWALMQDDLSGDKTEVGAFEFDETFMGIHLFPDNFRYSVTLFVIGTAIAFFSPLGGILQLIGGIGFTLTSATSQFEHSELIFWLGPAVAIIASVMVLSSLAMPLGMGYEDRRDVVGRLLTLSVYR
jgi:hypothetical protein